MILLTCGISQIISMKIPDLWIKYVKWLEGYFQEFPNVCLPQILYPNQMMLSAYSKNRHDLDMSICCLPSVIVWDPLKQFPVIFAHGINCFSCENKVSMKKWNVCQDMSSQPRQLQDIDSVALLIGVVYACQNHHQVLSYDPRLLRLFPEHFQIPFSLTHRTGFTKNLMNFIVAHIEQGQDFSKTLATIESCRSQFAIHVNSHCLSGFSNPRMSRFSITSIFLQNFFSEKEELFNDHMRSIVSNGWISIDHTFKVASNIGYFRSDQKWVTQYSSVFIIMNEEGEVLSWQLTKTETTSEVKELLESLLSRFRQKEALVHSIILDNCCQWRAFLQDVFGSDINVKLDIFHAVQRISRTVSKKDKYYSQFLSELRMVFRMVGDVGATRKMTTPNVEVLLQNLDVFVNRWEKIANLRDTTMKQLSNIKKHIAQGCLSGIPPGIGTNRNEALHRHLNVYFNKARLGSQAGYALLCLLFWFHNKTSSFSSEKQQLPNSSQSSVLHDHAYIKKEKFGIVAKISEPSSFWGTSSLMSFEDSMHMIADIEDNMNHDENIEYTSNEEAKLILQDVLNTTRMIEASENLFSRSPLLRKEFLPFLECHTKLCCDTEASHIEYHERRLDDLIHTCGLTRLSVPKDGNCCFTAVSLALKIVYDNVNSEIQRDFKAFPFDIEVEHIEIMSDLLRKLVYKEWLDNQEYYQSFVPDGCFEEEASKFLTSGFFMSSLGDTLVSARVMHLESQSLSLAQFQGLPFFSSNHAHSLYMHHW